MVPLCEMTQVANGHVPSVARTRDKFVVVGCRPSCERQGKMSTPTPLVERGLAYLSQEVAKLFCRLCTMKFKQSRFMRGMPGVEFVRAGQHQFAESTL